MGLPALLGCLKLVVL